MNLPDFLKPLDIETERTQILNALRAHESFKDYEPHIADDFSILINAFLYRLSLKIDEVNYWIAQNYIDYASNERLDELVKLLGLKRENGTPAIAKARVEAIEPTKILQNTIFKSADGVVAHALADYELQPGTDNFIYLSASTEGDYKTEILEINNLAVKKIQVLGAFKQEKKQESDDELRERFLLSLSRFSTAGSATSYNYYSHVSGVLKVRPYSPKPGNVTIIYHAKDEAPKELIAKALKDNIPLTDKVEYKKAGIVSVQLKIKLSLTPQADFATLQKEIQQDISALFAKLEIGESVSASKIIALAAKSPAVRAAELNEISTPASDEILELAELEIGI